MEHSILQSRTASLLFLILALNFLLWSASHNVRARWTGIPPAPSENTAAGITLGDRQFAYRSGALTLQNLGDTGGRTIALKDLDYNKLGKWFHLLNSLDPVSNHVPLIAAYYFGGIQASEQTSDKIRIVIDYLAGIGNSLEHNKWRWLAHAAFLARHKTEDLDYALELANKLASMDPGGKILPLWARHMPAFILTALDQKSAARALLEAVLLTDPDLPPAEINFLRSYLIEQLGVPEDEIGNSLVTVPQ
ncbi:MAG: hypothetical protein HND56_09195 [Pseudomonadota bacterium]|nr:hypothetical protein [Pseudomonadota bacterium]QKK05850.1 MAG: hypothetical protein HND56_09195 [Pseudomonadota bacterium]